MIQNLILAYNHKTAIFAILDGGFMQFLSQKIY